MHLCMAKSDPAEALQVDRYPMQGALRYSPRAYCYPKSAHTAAKVIYVEGVTVVFAVGLSLLKDAEWSS